ncbi:MAG: type IV pilin protein [Telluria sp.]
MPRFQTARPSRGAGVTLVELLVVVAIVGVLSAAAYPAYGRYLLKNNRAAAQVHLMELAQAQSQYMADSRSYAASVTALGMSTPAAVSAKYTIGIRLEDGPPAAFTITATPVGAQLADGALSINSAGTRTPAAKW